jgi:GT2 family glycosyltransferase
MTAVPPSDSGAPAVGIVVVNFNGGGLVLDAVGSALAQSLPPRRVLVMDNASSDGSAAAIAGTYPGVELVRLGRNAGFAAANNVGIEMLDDCEFVALLNPDAFADFSWLESLVTAARAQGDFASFASRIERANEPGVLDSAGDVYHVYGTAWPGRHGKPVASAAAPTEVFGASGAAVLYRREWLVRVGSFDERYFCYFEDVDLNLRLQVAGGRCLYVPDARVRHVGGATSGGLSEFTIYHSQRNVVWTYVKSMPPHLFWRYLPFHLLLNLGSIVTYGARGHTRTLLRAKRDAVLGLPAMLRARRSVMSSAEFDRNVLDRNMSRGLRVLLRETRP